ncbi:MAG: hypothetical protein PUE08_07220 [Eubacteriales bacterium]|nr:hypothetical protein [Eubacteriales bacterium]
MAKNVKKSYLIDAMYRPLMAMRALGNPKAIDSRFACDNGCTEEHYRAYYQQVLYLYKAASMFSFANNMTQSQICEIGGRDAWEKMKKPLRNRVYKAWKMLLEYSEELDVSNKLHCNPDDVCSVVGWVEVFDKPKNRKGSIISEYYHLGVDFPKGMPRKVLTTQTFENFQKKVETLLGIRLEEAAMLTVDERNYLREEKRLINRINSNKKEINRLEEKIKNLELSKYNVTDNVTLESINREQQKIQNIIDGTLEDGRDNLKRRLEKNLEALERLHRKGVTENATDEIN